MCGGLYLVQRRFRVRICCNLPPQVRLGTPPRLHHQLMIRLRHHSRQARLFIKLGVNFKLLILPHHLLSSRRTQQLPLQVTIILLVFAPQTRGIDIRIAHHPTLRVGLVLWGDTLCWHLFSKTFILAYWELLFDYAILHQNPFPLPLLPLLLPRPPLLQRTRQQFLLRHFIWSYLDYLVGRGLGNRWGED